MLLFFKRIKLFFASLFKRNIHYFDLLDEYEEYLCGQDISFRDTLLGTVRSTDQYDINYKHKFYHIPEKYVTNPDAVKYVALYRSKNLFTSKTTGVLHYGKVISCARMKRRDITELFLSYSYDEYYYKFEVDEWKELSNPIKVRETAPIVACMTSRFLLHNVKFANELLIEDNDTYILHMGLIDIIYGVYDGFFIGENKLRRSGPKIILINPKGKFYYSVSDYKRFPLACLKKISMRIFDNPRT